MSIRARTVTLLAMAATAATATVQMRWTTDTGSCSNKDGECTMLGPDGPWQAVVVMAGQKDPDSIFQIVDMPMWPAVGSTSGVLTTSSGGNYDPLLSMSAKKTGARHQDFGPWLANVFMNVTDAGIGYHEILHLETFQNNADDLNATIIAAESWDIRMPNGGKYDAPAGFLGLGPSLSEQEDNAPSSLLEQLKSTGSITSNSFGLHMGSAALGQRGSLILGGYEQNRALGEVGVFELVNDMTKAFLVDVTLGVEAGVSPFAKIGSMWKGVDESEHGADVTKNIGGAAGSAAVLPSPVTPYIYLPPGNCEALADQLPVTYRESLGLYTWNTEDPSYTRIVGSPAYMGFVLADQTAKNITIKIPFKLLNLTLEAPLVDEPTPYFPCKSVDSSYGVWQLGRAFLQGAFLGFNFEKDVMYIAQAPGPDMEQSVIRTLKVDDEVILTNAAESFEKTWSSEWEVLEDETDSTKGVDGTLEAGATPALGPNSPQLTNENREPESASSGEEAEGAQGQSQGQRGLPIGVISGIVVGAVIGLGLVPAGLLYWRRRRPPVQEVTIQDTKEYGPGSQLEVQGLGIKHELHAPRATHEAPGLELRHEMDGTGIGHR